GQERERDDGQPHQAHSEADVMPGDEDNGGAAPVAPAPAVDIEPPFEITQTEIQPQPGAEPEIDAPPPRQARKRPEPAPAAEDSNRPKRIGWWNKLKSQ